MTMGNTSSGHFHSAKYGSEMNGHRLGQRRKVELLSNYLKENNDIFGNKCVIREFLRKRYSNFITSNICSVCLFAWNKTAILLN